MNIIKININGTRFEFVCESRGTRSGFAHDCTLFINDIREQKVHCYYINRTWECWRYQSVCVEAVNAEIQYYTQRMLDKWKGENGYSRMTKTRKTDFDKYVENIPYIQTLKQCKQELKDKLWN